MGVVITPGFAEATQQFILTGARNPFSVTLGINPAPGDDAEIIAGLVRSQWNTHVWTPSVKPTVYALGPCRVERKLLSGELEVFTVETITQGTNGTVQILPPNCALLAQKRTGLGGRKNRGRMFVPPFMLNEADVDANGLINPSTLATVQGWFTSLFNGLDAVTQSPVLFHSDGSIPTQLTSFSLQNRIATQRERLR